MKRIIALLLTMIMMLGVMSGCTAFFGYDESYKGPILYAYFSDMPTTFDPMYAYTDEASSYIMSLLYEGLYKYDEDGKVVEGMVEEYKKTIWDKEHGEFQVEFKLKHSAWSDQTTVSAEHFVYAWQRILDPSNDSAAAAMLYQIKNARKIKNAEDNYTKYDIGATAVGTDVLRIDLETKKLSDGSYMEPDLDRLIENLASPCLVPVRSESVAKLTDWASSNATVLANGPFFLKNFDPQNLVRLERNRYYLRNTESDKINKYVLPYGIIIKTADRLTDKKGQTIKDFGSSANRAFLEYNDGVIEYLSYIPLEKRNEYKDKVELHDTFYTHSYFFNTKNPLFKDAKVRKALSMAIDREALQEELVFVRAAKSIVNSLAFENGYQKKNANFVSGSSISTTANVAEAKKLLSEAGVSGGSFTITIKDHDEVALATAEFCKKTWEGLGFSVSIRKLGTAAYIENDYDGSFDFFNLCLKANGDDFKIDLTGKTGYKGKTEFEGFDVIAVDFFQNSTDPFSVLAPFSKLFSGRSVDLSVMQGEYKPVLPYTSYNNDAYDALIEAAFSAEDDATRIAKLKDAEKLLMEEVPVMPLFTYQTPVMMNGLKKVEFDYLGLPNFNRLKFKDYQAKEEDEQTK